MKPAMRFSSLDAWVALCAFFSLAGWTLSALGLLTAVGYTGAIIIGLAIVVALKICSEAPVRLRVAIKKLRWRSRQPLSLLFMVYASLSILSGLMYSPSNYDALSYRLPRTLHWLAEHHWHWITTSNVRLNVTATGFEWLSAPVLALTSSDRLLFLINSISYLLMPGLVYGVFTRLGISKRAAWYWMWLLPTGYCYVLQAGSIGNDLFGTVFCLAAVYYALRAWQSRNVSDAWLSIVSGGLLTGAKATNLPLLLPLCVALIPSIKLLRNRIIGSVAVVTIAVMASFVPSAYQNLRHTGDWGGDPSNTVSVKLDSPIYGLLGNGLQLVVENLMPPLVPRSEKLNATAQYALKDGALRRLTSHYPRLVLVRINELAQEEAAGIGFGLSALILITLIAGLRWQMFDFRLPGVRHLDISIMVALGAFGALLAYMAKMGSEAAVRLMAPYYPLLLAGLLLIPGVAALATRRWWRIAALLAGLSALPAFVLSPARPLWPALTICRQLKERFPRRTFLDRAATVYKVYRNRSDSLAPLRRYIPEGSSEIGLIASGDDPETSLWRPFGKRKIVEILSLNNRNLVNEEATIIVNVQALESRFGVSVSGWMAENHLKVLGSEKLLLQVQGGWHDWLVVQPVSTNRTETGNLRESNFGG